ncbi:hypothetical protein CRG98_013993, partial [Punica granatum]
AAIVNSQTLEEVARLEKALKTGQLPADLLIFDDKIASNTAKGEDEEMVPSSQNEADVQQKKSEEQEQKGDEAAPMEQE